MTPASVPTCTAYAASPTLCSAGAGERLGAG